MVTVKMTLTARQQFAALPKKIRERVQKLTARLVDWRR
jgi:hypothetical protein